MKEATKRTLRLGCVACAIFATLAACDPRGRRVKTLADSYPDHLVFTPAQLARGRIAIEDANGKFGPAVEVGKLQYSGKALILLGNARAGRGFTVGELGELLDRNPGVAADIACSTTWNYNNEVLINGGTTPSRENCLVLGDSDMIASYQEQTRSSLSARPFLQAKLAPNRADDMFYRCEYTVSGKTTCNNSCQDANAIVCWFVSNDGLVSARVPQPTNEPTSASFSPCNDKTNCGGF